MKIDQDELAASVVRYVRSGRWKQMQTYKDKAIYRYLCDNLARREHNLARSRIVNELGPDTPAEVREQVKKTAQYFGHHVVHRETGRSGYLIEEKDGNLYVQWEDDPDMEIDVVGMQDVVITSSEPSRLPRQDQQYGRGQRVGLKNHDLVGSVAGYKFHDQEVLYLVEWDNKAPSGYYTAGDLYSYESADQMASFAVGVRVLDVINNVVGRVSSIESDHIVVNFSESGLGESRYFPTYATSRLKQYDESAPVPQPSFVAPFNKERRKNQWDDAAVMIGDNGQLMYEIKHKNGDVDLIHADEYGKQPASFSAGDIIKADSHEVYDTPYDKMIGEILHLTGYRNYSQKGAVLFLDGSINEDADLSDYKLVSPYEAARYRNRFEELKSKLEQADQPEGFAVGDVVINESSGDTAGSTRTHRIITEITHDGRIIAPNRAGVYEGAKPVKPELLKKVPDEFVVSAGKVGFARITPGYSKLSVVKAVDGNNLLVEVVDQIKDGKPSLTSEVDVEYLKFDLISREDFDSALSSVRFDVGDPVRPVGLLHGNRPYETYIVEDNAFFDSNNDRPRVNALAASDETKQILADQSSFEDVDFFESGDEVVLFSDKKRYIVDNVEYGSERHPDVPTVYNLRLSGSDEIAVSTVASGVMAPVETKIADFDSLKQYVGRQILISKNDFRTDPSLSGTIMYGKVVIKDIRPSDDGANVSLTVESTSWSSQTPVGRVSRFDVSPAMLEYLLSRSTEQGKWEEDERVTDYQPHDSSVVTDKQGNLMDYVPDSNKKGADRYLLHRFIKQITDFRERNPQSYNSYVKKNSKAFARFFDDMAFMQAHFSVGSGYRMLNLAEQNGHITNDARKEFESSVVNFRKTAFDNMDTDAISMVYDATNLKMSFAQMLIDRVVTEDPKNLASGSERTTIVESLGKILEDPRTYESFVKNHLYGRGSDDVFGFSDALRGRYSADQKYSATSQRDMLSKVLLYGSFLNNGDALSTIAGSMRGEAPVGKKINSLLGYMMGYKLDRDGDIVVGDDGKPVSDNVKIGAISFPAVPPKNKQNAASQVINNRITTVYDMATVSFDLDGRPITEFAGEIQKKYPAVNKNDLISMLTHLATKKSSSGFWNEATKRQWSPQLIAALSDKSITDGRYSLTDIVARTSLEQSSTDELWKQFTPGWGSVPTGRYDMIAGSVVDGTITLQQANFLVANDPKIVETVIDKTKKPGETSAEFASRLIGLVRNGQGIGAIGPDSLRSFIASDTMIRRFDTDELTRLFEEGLFKGVDFSDAKKGSSVDAVFTRYKQQIYDEFIKTGDFDRAVEQVKSKINNESIVRRLIKEATLDNISVDALKGALSAIADPEQRKEKAQLFYKHLASSVRQKGDYKYLIKQEGNYNFIHPLHQVFDFKGNPWPAMMSYLDEEEAKGLYDKIGNFVKGVSDEDVSSRMFLAKNARAMEIGVKRLSDTMWSVLPEDKRDRFAVMRMALTGDNIGSDDEDAVLRNVHNSLKTVGMVDEDTASKFYRMMGFSDSEIESFGVLGQSRSTLIRNCFSKIASEMTYDDAKIFVGAMEKRIDKLASVIQNDMIEDDVDAGIQRLKTIVLPIELDESGKKKLKLDLQSIKAKELYGKLGAKSDADKIRISDAARASVGDQKTGTVLTDNEYVEIARRLQVNQDQLRDFVIEAKQIKAPDMSHVVSRMKNRISDFSKNQNVEKNRADLSNQLSSVIGGVFEPLLTPAYQGSDALAVMVPHDVIVSDMETKLPAYHVKNIPGVIGKEVLIIADPDESKNSYTEQEGLDDEQKSIRRDAINTLNSSSLRVHGQAPWVRAEIFNVDRDGKKEKVMAVREFQNDPVQQYVNKRTWNVGLGDVKNGDKIEILDPDRVSKYNEEVEELFGKYGDTPEFHDAAAQLEFPKKMVVNVSAIRKSGHLEWSDDSGKKTGVVARKISHSIKGDVEKADSFSERQVQQNGFMARVMTEREVKIRDEMLRYNNVLFRALFKSAMIAKCDKVYVLPSWTMRQKSDMLSKDRYDPSEMVPIDVSPDFRGKLAFEDVAPKGSKTPTRWVAKGIPYTWIASYDHLAEQWGMEMKDLDHFYQTDPFAGYTNSMLVTQARVADLNDPNWRANYLGRRLARKTFAKRLAQSVNEVADFIVLYLRQLFAMAYNKSKRGGHEWDLNKTKEILAEGYEMAKMSPAIQNIPQDTIKAATRIAGDKIGVDLTDIEEPAWKYGPMPEEALDSLINIAEQYDPKESHERPDPKVLAERIDRLLEYIVPKAVGRPEYQGYTDDVLPFILAKEMIDEPTYFPEKVVRDDLDYQKKVFDLVTAYPIKQPGDESAAGEQEMLLGDEFDDIAVSDDDGGTAMIGSGTPVEQWANEASQWLRKEGDSYENFVRWIDSDAVELHALEDQRAAVERLLRQRGFELKKIDDAPSAEDLEQWFREGRKGYRFAAGDKVYVRYAPVDDVRVVALAKKSASATVVGRTKEGYVLRFDRQYDEEVLNRQKWLFADGHLEQEQTCLNQS